MVGTIRHLSIHRYLKIVSNFLSIVDYGKENVLKGDTAYFEIRYLQPKEKAKGKANIQ